MDGIEKTCEWVHYILIVSNIEDYDNEGGRYLISRQYFYE